MALSYSLLLASRLPSSIYLACLSDTPMFHHTTLMAMDRIQPDGHETAASLEWPVGAISCCTALGASAVTTQFSHPSFLSCKRSWTTNAGTRLTLAKRLRVSRLARRVFRSFFRLLRSANTSVKSMNHFVPSPRL
jgi:hypothetical protein